MQSSTTPEYSDSLIRPDPYHAGLLDFGCTFCVTDFGPELMRDVVLEPRIKEFSRIPPYPHLEHHTPLQIINEVEINKALLARCYHCEEQGHNTPQSSEKISDTMSCLWRDLPIPPPNIEPLSNRT
jgi:hypothetical protein